MDPSVLGLLSKSKNQSILSLLAVEPSYPRRVAQLLGFSESETARRLRQMEKAGIVAGEWTNVGGNVKLYRLVLDRLQIRFGPEGMGLAPGSGSSRAEVAFRSPVEQRVPTTTGFVGRESELRELAGGEPVSVVLGIPGIGKTSLVAQYAAKKLQDRAVFWYSCRGVESLNWLANRLALFLAPQGDPRLLRALEEGLDPAEKRALVMSALDNPNCAFVFDDMHRVEDPAVRDLIVDACGALGKGRILIASREGVGVHPQEGRVRVLHLEGLEDIDMERYLRENGVDVRPGMVPRLRDEVGGHPFALALLVEASRSEGRPLLEILEGAPKADLEMFLMQEVTQTLAEDELAVLTLASMFRTGFSKEDLESLSSRNVTGPLLRLRRRLLVESVGDTYVMHETLRNFFYHNAGDRKKLHKRLARHYLDKETEEGRLEAMHHLLAAGRRDEVLGLLERNLDLRDFEAIDAGYHDLYYNVLAMFRPEDVGNDRLWALIEDEKGDILYHRGEWEAALRHYSVALSTFQDRRDAARSADVFWKRALALVRLERPEEAAALCKEGLKAAPAKGRERDRLRALGHRLVQE